MKIPTLNRYTYIFGLLNLALLLTALFTLLTILGWKALLEKPVMANPTIYTRLSLNHHILNAGFIGSASTLLTVLISLWTFSTRPTRENAKSLPLRVYFLSLLITFIITLISASLIWFSTLREQSLFRPVWQSLSPNLKIYIQNDLSCCGWFNPTNDGLFDDSLRSGFCEDPESIRADPDPNVVIGCVDKFDKRADDILNNIFTISYGFNGLQFSLFLISAAIAHLRVQQKRFMRIDYKLRSAKGSFI